MNQSNVDNAMQQLVEKLGTEMGIFAEDNEISVSVINTETKKVERILRENNIEFKKDGIDDLVITYTFEGQY